MERSAGSAKFPIGSKLPQFKLPNVDGRELTERFFEHASMSLVVFTCNHCPYVKGSEDELVNLAREFAPRGLKVVTISSNDAAQYPDDSFEHMKLKAVERQLPYPYLYDESQEVARAFDAACTPECYLFDASGVLVFHGAINDNPKQASAARQGYLRAALEQLSRGQEPNPSFAHPIGCSIKWRQ